MGTPITHVEGSLGVVTAVLDGGAWYGVRWCTGINVTVPADKIRALHNTVVWHTMSCTAYVNACWSASFSGSVHTAL